MKATTLHVVETSATNQKLLLNFGLELKKRCDKTVAACQL